MEVGKTQSQQQHELQSYELEIPDHKLVEKTTSKQTRKSNQVTDENEILKVSTNLSLDSSLKAKSLSVTKSSVKAKPSSTQRTTSNPKSPSSINEEKDVLFLEPVEPVKTITKLTKKERNMPKNIAKIIKKRINIL